MENVKTVNKQTVKDTNFAKTNLGLVDQEGSSNYVLRGNVQDWGNPNQVKARVNNRLERVSNFVIPSEK